METNQYFIGLDMGTNSVGFAVTDTNYKILKNHQKAMWGVRMFDEAATAAKRRLSRSARRRRARQVLRLKLLQDFFSSAIAAIDPGFYQRMKDSFFLPSDKAEEQRFALFNDQTYTDADFHKAYPTIYHLRHELMTDPSPHDPRLVYLACHHILKRRGHFLYEGEINFKSNTQLNEQIFPDFKNALASLYDVELSDKESDSILSILQDNRKRAEKETLLLQALSWDEAELKTVVRLLLGYKVTFAKLFGADYQDVTPKDIQFDKAGIEEELEEKVQPILPETEYLFLLSALGIYNYIKLASLLKDSDTFSQAKINIYKKHKADLLALKRVLRTILTPKDYFAFFNKSESGPNYVAYSGYLKTSKGKQPVTKRCTQAELNDEIRKIINKAPEALRTSADAQYILTEIEDGLFLPKAVAKENGLIPNQLQTMELKRILSNAAEYLPFLKQAGPDGYTVQQMIEQLASFRIPYFVGPLNPHHSIKDGKRTGSNHAWVTRLSSEPVRPWNFQRVVDLDQSATDFIANLTNKCTYLYGEDVLPKDSPIYSRFMVLNILNLLSVRNERISVDLKQKIFNDLFLNPPNHQKVTRKRVAEYLRTNSYPEITEAEIGGMDLEIPVDLKAHRNLERIAPNLLSENEKGEIVRLITVFPDSGGMLKRRLTALYAHKLSPQQLDAVSRLNFSGWGRLSEKLLTGLKIRGKNGQMLCLLDLMWEDNQNLMELLAAGKGFRELIDAENQKMTGPSKTLSYSLVDDLPIAPSVKKMLWQTLKIVKELVKVNKAAPAKIMIEAAREEGKKERTVSRKDQFARLYESIRDINRNWKKEISETEAGRFNNKKLYLYYTQMGKCMYSGKPIELERLYEKSSDGKELYDIDHIYPRSLTKDDSITNNLVLVNTILNRDKSDTYPLDHTVQTRQAGFWRGLLASKLITEEKFRRLMRTTRLTDDELANFINRQLVETRQATKAAKEILEKIYPDTRIVYVKAGLVSDFRKELGFLKVRDMNNLHHAKDAYLNIVVGNVFDTKFTQNPRNYLRDHPKRSYNLARMYDFDVRGADGSTAWQAGPEGSIQMVDKMMKRNNILTTYQTHHQKSGQSGGLYDQNIVSKGRGQHPIKTGDPRLTGEEGISKYGAYNNETGYGFFIVDHQRGKRQVRTILPISLSWKMRYGTAPSALQKYCEEVLQLKDPVIFRTDLPYNAILLVNDFPLRLLAKTGTNLKLAPVPEPFFDQEYELALRNLAFTKPIGRERPIMDPDSLETELYQDLFELVLRKLQGTPYNRLSVFRNQEKNIEAGRENFQKLNPTEKAELLRELLVLFQCDGRLSDLSLLQPKGVNGERSTKNKQSGMITITQNIQPNSDIWLLTQSPTGLFEKRVKLSAT